MSLHYSTASVHPHFILKYDVVEDFGTKRMAHRDALINLAGRYKREGKLVMGGALADMTGVRIVFRNREDVENFMKEDPYVNNGLVIRHEIMEWSVVM